MHPIVRIASWFVLLAPFVLLFVDVTTAAEDLEKQTKALNIISDFANRICVTVPQTGTSGKVELSGKARAELNEFLKKMANLGIEGAAQYQKLEWNGVLQQDIAEQINRSRDCQLEVFRALKDKLLLGVQSQENPPRVIDGNLLTELQEDQPDWVINGNNYNLVNSQLSSQGLFTAYVRNSKWDNYAVEFELKQLVGSDWGFNVLIRRQSDTDYVALQLYSWTNCRSRLVIVRSGRETILVNSEIHYRDCGTSHYRIEVNGNRYKISKDGSEIFIFNNNTFLNGGVGIKSRQDNLTFAIENFKVARLQ